MKQLFIFLLFSIAILTIAPRVFAQGMLSSSIVSSTAQDEVKGKQAWEKLQAKKASCSSLKDNDFEFLGEYFMSQMAGNTQRHAFMNQMMQNMMGKNQEEQMHIVFGKQLSGCEPNAQFPQNGAGFMSMMGMMGSTGSPQVGGGGNSMMGFGNVMGWNGFGFFGFLIWIFWIVVLVDLILLGAWLWKKIKK